MKTILVLSLLFILLIFALYQVRVALKTIKDSKINPTEPQDKITDEDTDNK